MLKARSIYEFVHVVFNLEWQSNDNFNNISKYVSKKNIFSGCFVAK